MRRAGRGARYCDPDSSASRVAKESLPDLTGSMVVKDHQSERAQFGRHVGRSGHRGREGEVKMVEQSRLHTLIPRFKSASDLVAQLSEVRDALQRKVRERRHVKIFPDPVPGDPAALPSSAEAARSPDEREEVEKTDDPRRLSATRRPGRHRAGCGTSGPRPAVAHHEAIGNFEATSKSSGTSTPTPGRLAEERADVKAGRPLRLQEVEQVAAR